MSIRLSDDASRYSPSMKLRSVRGDVSVTDAPVDDERTGRPGRALDSLGTLTPDVPNQQKRIVATTVSAISAASGDGIGGGRLAKRTVRRQAGLVSSPVAA